MQQETGQERTNELADDVAWDFLRGKSARESKGDRHRGIDMRAGHLSDGINHGHDDQPKCQRNSGMRDSAAGKAIYYYGAASCEHERERAENLREILSHERAPCD